MSRSANTTIQKWVFRRCAQYLQFKLAIATIHNISEKYFTWYVLMFCPIASWSGNTEPEQTKNECPDVTRRASIKLSTDFFKLQIFWFQMSSKFSEKYSYPLQFLKWIKVIVLLFFTKFYSALLIIKASKWQILNTHRQLASKYTLINSGLRYQITMVAQCFSRCTKRY